MNWISTLQQLQNRGTPATIVTIVKTRGSTPRDVGTKMLVSQDEIFGTIGGGQLEELVIHRAREILATHQKPERVPYALCLEANQCCGGFVEVLIETINTGPLLLLFGAGHVAQAVAKILEGTGFLVHMIDSRAEWIKKAPASTVAHQDRGPEFIAAWQCWHPDKTYAVVMTYDHDLDQLLVEKLLDMPLKYLGLIGSATKWRRFKSRLLESGSAPKALEKVKCPIGLAIGGKSPQEVAISFAGEIMQLQNETLKNSQKSAFLSDTSDDDAWLEELR